MLKDIRDTRRVWQKANTSQADYRIHTEVAKISWNPIPDRYMPCSYANMSFTAFCSQETIIWLSTTNKSMDSLGCLVEMYSELRPLGINQSRTAGLIVKASDFDFVGDPGITGSSPV